MIEDPVLQSRIIQELRREEMAKASRMASPDFQGRMTANEMIGRPPMAKRDALLSVLQAGVQPMQSVVQNNVNQRMKRLPLNQTSQPTGMFSKMMP